MNGPLKLNAQYTANGILNFDNGIKITNTNVTILVSDDGDISGWLNFEAYNADQLNAAGGEQKCNFVGTLNDTGETVELRELIWTNLKDDNKPDAEKFSIETNFKAKTILINPSACYEDISENITIEFGILGLYEFSRFGINHFNGIQTEIGLVQFFYYPGADSMLKKMNDTNLPYITQGVTIEVTIDNPIKLQTILDRTIDSIQKILTLTSLMQGSMPQLGIIRVKSNTQPSIFVQRFMGVKRYTKEFDIMCDRFPELFQTYNNLTTSLEVDSGLSEAIDWYIESINGKTFEYQFISAAICLELLVDRFGKKYNHEFVLDSEKFKNIRNLIQGKISQILKEHQVEKGERKSIYEKLGELNRKSFKEKILSLIDHYNIKFEIDGTNTDILVDEIITIRNIITHQGIYVDSLSMYPKIQEEFNKILHLIIRILLSIIDYRGPYYMPGAEPERIEYLDWKNPPSETRSKDNDSA